ncbi:MAG: sulfotransferase [Gammaproteobacteria bacterium]|nr:sulfotransferase [Gammaproteobacteria bacterium]
MDERKNRLEEYQFNDEFEDMMKDVNLSLIDSEKKLVNTININFKDKLPPIIFFCYAPRSGSTLLSQILARTNHFSYISNFTARFWEAPVTALTIEKKLGIRNISQHDSNYKSNYGLTKFVSDPHEFGFFWNKLLTSTENHYIDLKKIDQQKLIFLRDQINAMRSIYQKPFFIKNGITSYNTSFVKKLFPDAKFVFMKRELPCIVQSILTARNDFYGDSKIWWSLKPKNFNDIVNRSNNEIEEIIYQIKSIYDEIENGFSHQYGNVFKLNYENLCENTETTLTDLYSFVGVEEEISQTFLDKIYLKKPNRNNKTKRFKEISQSINNILIKNI